MRAAGPAGPRPGAVLLLTMLWIAGLPTFVVFGNRLLASVPLLKADRLVYLLASVAFVIEAWRRPRWLRPAGWVERALVLYLAVVLLSWGTTVPGKDVTTLKQDADFLLTCFLMPFTAFVIARNTAWNPRRITACLWILVGGVGTYLVLYGAAQYLYDWNFLVAEAVQHIHPNRAKGPFENAIPYGVVVSTLLPLTLLLYHRASNRWKRGVLVLIAFGLVQSIVASKARVVWIAVPIALLLPAVRWTRMRLLSLLLVVDLVAQIFLAPAIGSDRLGLQTRLVEAEPFYNRVAVWATAWNMITHKPLLGFGFGLGTFQQDNVGYYTSWGTVSPEWALDVHDPHNDVLNVLVLMGMVGLVAYLLLLWTSWQLLSRNQVRWRSRNPLGSELATVVQAIFIILMVSGLSHSLMYVSYPQVLLFFLLGMVASEPDAATRGADQTLVPPIGRGTGSVAAVGC